MGPFVGLMFDDQGIQHRRGSTTGVIRAVGRLDYDVGSTVSSGGTNYVTAALARGGLTDAVAIDAVGTVTQAVLRVGQKGFEVARNLGPVARP